MLSINVQIRDCCNRPEADGINEVCRIKLQQLVSFTFERQDRVGTEPDVAIHTRREVDSEERKVWVRNLTHTHTEHRPVSRYSTFTTSQSHNHTTVHMLTSNIASVDKCWMNGFLLLSSLETLNVWNQLRSLLLIWLLPILLSVLLPARCYASVGSSYGPVSVCLSVCHKSEFYRNGWTNWAALWHDSFLILILYYVTMKSVYPPKQRHFLWNFATNSVLPPFRQGTLIAKMFINLAWERWKLTVW